MTWNVTVSEEARAFLRGLTDDERNEVEACILLLRKFGPNLHRPYADTLKNSKHSNMKELRVRNERKQFRILYAFDPQQNAILLVGGDKVSLGRRWYPKFIGIADRLYDKHLENLEAERKQEKTATKAAKKAREKRKAR